MPSRLLKLDSPFSFRLDLVDKTQSEICQFCWLCTLPHRVTGDSREMQSLRQHHVKQVISVLLSEAVLHVRTLGSQRRNVQQLGCPEQRQGWFTTGYWRRVSRHKLSPLQTRSRPRGYQMSVYSSAAKSSSWLLQVVAVDSHRPESRHHPDH